MRGGALWCFLIFFLQKSIDIGKVSSAWKKAHITLVLKKSDKSFIGYYRPISQISVVLELPQHIVYSSIVNVLDDNDILLDLQHGLRSHFSCKTD